MYFSSSETNCSLCFSVTGERRREKGETGEEERNDDRSDRVRAVCIWKDENDEYRFCSGRR